VHHSIPTGHHGLFLRERKLTRLEALAVYAEPVMEAEVVPADKVTEMHNYYILVFVFPSLYTPRPEYGASYTIHSAAIISKSFL
jgi:hypothetical protein